MLRRWVLSSIAVGLMASALLAKQGVVISRGGDTFSGDITEDAKFVTVDLHGVKTKLDKRNVAKITYAQTIEEQFNDRHAKLAADDVKGRAALAAWASDNNRADLAVTVLEEARKIDPMNRDVAQQLVAAQQQVQIDQEAGKSGANAGHGPTTAVTPLVKAPVTAPPVGEKNPPLVRRLLNNDEVNIIRQKEMGPEDKVRVQFTNDVIKQYLASGDHDAVQFHKQTPVQQAIEIFTSGDAKMANQVRIMTDPPPLAEFRQKIYPIISVGCAATGCHGSTRGGTFGLYQGESVNAIYTNFYTMMSYASTINGTQYTMLDRTLPDRSLFLQYSLPPTQSDVAHPEVKNFRPRFHTKTDLPYTQVLDWLNNSLKAIPPDYGIKVSPKLPATQPAGGPPAH